MQDGFVGNVLEVSELDCNEVNLTEMEQAGIDIVT